MPKEYLYHIKRQDIASLVDTSSRRVLSTKRQDVASTLELADA